MKKCPFCAEEIQDEAIKCKHCGEKFELGTKKCSHCGAENNSEAFRCRNENCSEVLSDSQSFQKQDTRKGSGWGIPILITIIALIFIMYFIGTNSNTSAAKSDYPSQLYIRVYANSYVKQLLKAPSTAKFPYEDEYKIENIGERRWRVYSYVDSQNSFGAMLRNYFTVEMECLGKDEWKLIDIKLHE